MHAQPRYSKRGRPGRDAQPDQVIYHVDGALASSLAARQGLIDQHSCFILATNELDDTQRSPQEGLHGYKGQGQAERGFRFVQAPQFLAASLYLKKPKRIMQTWNPLLSVRANVDDCGSQKGNMLYLRPCIWLWHRQ